MNLNFILGIVPSVLYLPIALVCTAIIVVFFKVAKHYRLVAEQAIAVNFLLVCLLMIAFFQPEIPKSFKMLPWVFFIPLGLLTSASYIFLSKAITHAGIARALSTQHLTVITPLVGGALLSWELPAQQQLLTLGIAFLALLMLLARNSKKIDPEQPDIPTAQQMQLRQQASEQATVTLFSRFFLICLLVSTSIITVLCQQLSSEEFIYGLIFAFGFGFAFMLLFVFLCYQTWTLNSALSGIILGFFSFFGLLFFLKAQQHFATSLSHFFTTYHLSSILMGSVLGVFIFREKLGLLNLLGITLSIALTITIAQ